MGEFRYRISYSRKLAHFPAINNNAIISTRRKISSLGDVREVESLIHSVECENLSRQMRENGFGCLSASPLSKDNPDLKVTITQFDLLS